MSKYLVVLFLILANSFSSSSQNQIIVDSLQVELKNAESQIEEAEIYLQLSRLYWRTNYQLSEDYASQAVNLMQKHKDSPLYAKSYRYLGNSFLLSGDYDEALKQLLEGLKIAEEIKDKYERYAITISIGSVYDRLKNFEESLKYYFEALNMYNESTAAGNDNQILQGAVTLYNNIGNNYHSRNELQKAEEYYQKGLLLAESRNDLFNIGIISNNIGKIKAALNEDDEALKYFRTSEETRMKTNDKSGLAVTYYFIAEFYLNDGNYNKAVEYSLKSFDLADEVGALLTKETATEILTVAYDSLHDYTNALHYYKILKTVSDSLFNEQTIQEITRLKLHSEQARIDNERLKETQRTKLKYTIFISVLIICLVVLAAFFIVAKNNQRRLRTERKEIENSILQKKKELATNVLYLLRKNETLESVTKKLLTLKKNLADKNKPDIQRIIMELQSEIDTNSWKEFELRFQDVHQGFYDKLHASFPDLTPTERKLAAFLKLNMSSKEISVITGQSIRSLEVARYRLRKKLGITNQEVNLTNFLSEL